MADSASANDSTANHGDDVVMDGQEPSTAVADEATASTAAAPRDPNQRVEYLDYLRSPMVELVVGTDAARTTLTAHQALLTKSPHLAELCATLPDTKRTLDLPGEDLDAVGAFLEYLYTGDYFPRHVDEALESHASLPAVDLRGEQLLRHARVYTLADKFALPALKTLAHRKIRLTTSTARGEIAYARYVYATTAPDDTTIRAPVAKFWATRSYVLRHDAEAEFQAMCLEFPQFGFDVLSKVLDAQERQRGSSAAPAAGPGVAVGIETPTGSVSGGRGRKRGRLSEA